MKEFTKSKDQKKLNKRIERKNNHDGNNDSQDDVQSVDKNDVINVDLSKKNASASEKDLDVNKQDLKAKNEKGSRDYDTMEVDEQYTQDAQGNENDQDEDLQAESKDTHEESSRKRKANHGLSAEESFSFKKIKSENSSKNSESKAVSLLGSAPGSLSGSALKTAPVVTSASISSPAPVLSPLPLHNHAVAKLFDDNKDHPKTHTNERSISPNSILPEKDVGLAKERSPSPVPVIKILEEQKAKNAEEARIWQEKAEAKKRARREMFLKYEKEREMKRKEEEDKRLEEERIQAELKKQEDLRQALEEEARRKELEARKTELRKIKALEYYPIGLKRVRFNSKPTEFTIAKYLPLYIFVINEHKFVLDLHISLLTLTPFENLLSSRGSESKVLQNEIESAEKSKLWKLYYPLIGVDTKKQLYNGTLDSKQEGEKLFQNLSLKFVKYDDIMPDIKEKFSLVAEKIETLTCIEVDLKFMTGFDYSDDSIVRDLRTGKLEESQPANLGKFVPPSLMYRKDIIKTLGSSRNRLW